MHNLCCVPRSEGCASSTASPRDGKILRKPNRAFKRWDYREEEGSDDESISHRVPT